MFVIYIEVDGGRAIYHSEYNDILSCRDAIIELAEAGKRAHFSQGYMGPEIKVI